MMRSADAIDAERDSELAADVMGMDVEDDAEGAAATADGGMIVDDDDAINNIGILCVFHPTYRTVGPRPRHNN